uniref:(northern house mosquito) hypothetical protein n=1 Tax=Culex pipiens TaxID=7175 RepID=A0A8D8AUD9_CULPI
MIMSSTKIVPIRRRSSSNSSSRNLLSRVLNSIGKPPETTTCPHRKPTRSKIRRGSSNPPTSNLNNLREPTGRVRTPKFLHEPVAISSNSRRHPSRTTGSTIRATTSSNLR